MKIDVLIFIIIISFSGGLMLVSGAGGGGGGGNGGGSGGSGGGSSGGGGSSVTIPEFSEVSCYEDGSIEFQMKEKQDIIAVKKSGGEEIIVSGNWSRYGKFISDEVIFVDKGEYNITKEDITRTFSCPGLKLACSLVEFNDIYCKDNSDGLSAGFKLVHETDINNLKFNFVVDDKTISYTSDIFNNLLKGLKVKIDKQEVSLIISEKLGATQFEVINTKCIGKRYIYSRIACSDSVQIKESINPNELKCGGLLVLKDRVKCRINLNSEKEEYQNFFPEECKNHKDPNKCLSIYRSVSECWDISDSNGRISCLKDEINLKDPTEERINCNDNNCKKELNDKILTMIKLRFYNLEEQAEILEERGLLDEEDLINFVVEIENKKLEFNDAKTKEEMKDIIFSVKKMWKELLREIK